MEAPPSEVTSLLHAWGAGDRTVEQRLFELVLPDLHALADKLMRRERPDHSLQASELLDEVYLRLVDARQRDWQNRTHFFALAARAMRRLLIDHARARMKGRKIPIDAAGTSLPGHSNDIELAVAVDGLLDEMGAAHPDWCSLIELKFFMGLTDDEAARALGIPLRTMQRKFGDARRWMYERLRPRSCDSDNKTTIVL